MKTRMLLIILVLFAGAEMLIAQECKISVEYNAGNAFVQNISTIERSYSPGSWQSFSQEHITKIENTGRNDLLIRTRNVATNQTAIYHTINNGQQTIWFPLPNFAGTALHEVQCLPYATIHDATELISEFGGGVQAFLTEAETAATNSAIEAKNNLLALADPAAYQNFQQEMNQKQNQLNQKWQELQQLAAEGMDEADMVLSEHFPELHAAIEATNNVTVDLQWAILETHGNNLEELQRKLREIDRKLGVSDFAGELASINPEEHFPELFALGAASCEIDPSLFNEAASEMNRFHDLFSRFMEELANRADLPGIPFTQSDIDQLNSLLTQPPCLDELVEARRLLIDDLQSFVRYVESIQANLEIWQRRWFIRGNEEMFQESQRLAQTSAELAEHLVQQHILEQEANQAKREMDDSHEKLGRIHGRGGQSIDLLVVRIDLMVPSPDYLFAPNDEEQIKQQIEEHQKTIDNYEAAVLARENNLQQIQRLSGDWLNDVSSLAASVSRVRITAPTVRRFMDLVNDQPRLNLPGSSIRLVQSCITGINQNLQTASAIFSNGFRTFYDDLANFAESMMPEGLKLNYEALYQTSQKLNNDLDRYLEFKNALDELRRSQVELRLAQADLALSVSSSPFNPDYSDNIESRLATLNAKADDLIIKRERVTELRQEAYPNIWAYIELRLELRRNHQELARNNRSTQLNSLMDSIEKLGTTLEATVQTGNSIAECINTELELLRNTLDSFEQRKIAFALFIQEMLPDPIPDEVRSGVTNLARLTAEQLVHVILPNPLVKFEEANNVWQLAGLNLIIPDLMTFTLTLWFNQDIANFHLNQAFERIQSIEIETKELQNHLQIIAENHNEAMQELQLLREWVRTNTGEVASDISDLQLAALNISPILQNTDHFLALAPLWAEAVYHTPLQMPAVAGNEIAQRLESLRPQVEQGMQNFVSVSSAAVSCATDVVNHRSGIAAQSVNTAVSQAIADIQAQAPVVYSNLQGLLNPIQSALSSVEQVITAGKSLLDNAKNSPAQAKSNFENLVSSNVAQIQNSIACVNDRSITIQQQVDQLTDWFTEIEGVQTFQPLQLQTISFPIQN